MISRRRATVVLAVLICGLVASAVLVVARGGGDAIGADEARIEVDGSVTRTAVDGSVETLTRDAMLSFGDRIVVAEGSAVVELVNGQRYEVRAEPTPSELEIGAPPRLLAGDVLVSEGFPAQVEYRSTTVSAMGAMKVVAAVPSVVSYAGRARVDGAGELDEVLGLRQVVLTSSAVPEPLAYDGSDEWDRRYLGDAIAFGKRLEALARGYTADLGGSARSATFFEAVIPALGDEREFGNDLLEGRDAGETIVGASIVVQGRNGTFRERWDEVFTFREQGAAWGLVALDQGVSSAPLLATVELAVGAPRPAANTTTTTPSTSPTEPTSPTPDGPDTGPPTTRPPPPDPSPPTTGLLDPVLDPVATILQDLLGVIGL